jgi:hypothetical protein
MAKLWLTYAWTDNEDASIDHVITELRAAGVEVQYDRKQIVAGKRLWQQIDRGITDPASCDGWAIFVTKNSLESEPCQEELAIALDRALRARGDFPLIAIFPEPIDRAIIPSALATRLYVTLRDPEWVRRVADAVAGTQTIASVAPPLPFHVQWHGDLCVEVRPRSGRWFPFYLVVPAAEKHKLKFVEYGPYGAPRAGSLVNSSSVEIDSKQGKFAGTQVSHAIDNLTAAFIRFNERPTMFIFGQYPSPSYQLSPS